MSDYPAVSSKAQHLNSVLDTMGVEHRLEMDFSYSEIVTEHRSQIRDANHIAPSKRITEYAHQSQAGAIFPPLVVDKKTMELVDGSTRLEAFHGKLQRTHGPVIIADFPTVTLRKLFAGKINQQSGERLSSNEAKRLAILLIEEGYSDDQISMDCGTSAHEVELWRNEYEARNKLQGHLTAAQESNLLPSHYVRLNQVKWGTAFMRETAKLIADAAIDTKSTSKYITAINKRDSQDEAFIYLEQLRNDPETRAAIVAVKSGQIRRATRPSATAAIKMAAGVLRKRTIDEYVQELSEASDDVFADLDFIANVSDQLVDAFTVAR